MSIALRQWWLGPARGSALWAAFALSLHAAVKQINGPF
jgi:hypothetical protein